MINISLYAILKSLSGGYMEVVTTKGLVYRRKSLSLTQARLAEAIGVSAITICRWENGSQTPSIPMCRTLCEFFGCSFDELLQDPACTSPPPEGGGSSAGVRGELPADKRPGAGVTDGVIMLELVIRQEGVEVMNNGNMDQGGIRVTKLVYPDKSVAFEIAGRSAAVSSRQELEAFLSRVVDETMDTFRFDDKRGEV